MKKFDIKKLTPVIYVFSVLILLWVVFRLMIFFLPFVIATLIIQILNPLVQKIIKITKLNSRFVGSIILFIFYVLIISLIAFITLKALFEIVSLITNLVKDKEIILKFTEEQVQNIYNYISILPDYTINFVSSNIEKIINFVTQYFVTLLNSSLSLIKSIPKLIVFFVVTILSSFIILKDKKIISKFLKNQIPKPWLEVGIKIKEDVITLIFNYLKAQLVLITMCFFELLIGLTIINYFVTPINFILITAIIIAIVDALPILGTGTVLVPWALTSILAFNNYYLGISLFILYATIFLVRQYFEPKVISSKINMNPLLSLIAIYGGFKVFGVLGFLYGPIIMTILKIVFSEEIKYGFFKYLINYSDENEENNEEIA